MTDEELEMHEAASNGDTHELGFLLASRVDVNIADEDGNTALHEAVTPEVVSLLLKYGAKVNVINRFGMTPLHANIENDNDGGVKLLLEAKAATTVKNKAGLTPLHFAIAKRSAESVEAIIRHDPYSVNYCNFLGENAIKFARSNKRVGMINEIWRVTTLMAQEKRGIEPLIQSQLEIKRLAELDSDTKRQKTLGVTLSQ
jgi:ankyrin repeat protein